MASAFHLIELENDSDLVDIEAVSDAVILFGHAEPLASRSSRTARS